MLIGTNLLVSDKNVLAKRFSMTGMDNVDIEPL